MMSSIRSLNLLHLLLGVFLVHPEGGVCLELLPSASEVLLVSNSNFTVVCSGWSQVTWRLPRDTLVDGVAVATRGSSSILQLSNVTWMNSGRYTCEETSSDQSRHVDVFVPGPGPDEWFVPVGTGVVMKEVEEVTIPCVVSDPQLSVWLLERPSRTPVTGTYEPGRGFTGRLNDTSYVCLAAHGGEERESQVYYVFSIVVPQVMEVDLSVSSSVLTQGEVLIVNCTVTGLENVYFSWTFPRRQEVEPLTDFLPNQIRSFVNISTTTVADSGVYECEVQERTRDQRVTKNITVTVLERGYVYLWPSGDTSVSSLLHHTVALNVEIDAYPTPTVIWTRDNQTVAMETTSITTTHLTGCRYETTLTLVRVRMDQTGSYTATVSNDDGIEEVVFNLEVKAPPRITSLSEVSSKAVLCVSEGAPPPSVTWYICNSSHRCSNVTGGWRSLSAASEGVSLQENVSEVERGVTQVHSELTLQALTSLSAVRCEAKNSAGRRVRDLRVQSPSLLSQVAVLAAVLVLVIIAVFFLIVLIVLWRKKPRYEAAWKLIQSSSPDGRRHTYLDSSHLPYNALWEIPRENIVLGQVLGSGAFGRVVEGKVSDLIDSNSTTKAAVKMLKKNSGAAQSLMSELKVLVHLGPHMNIVNLLGACTRGGPVYLITEFCRHGDLVNFLQRNKHNFLLSDQHNKSDSDGGYMDMTKERGSAVGELRDADIELAPHESPHESPQAAPGQQEASSLLLNDPPLLSLNDLLSFSYQISQAMDFLSTRNCVHRDLAARNVLVCEGKLVKVCDFGLARDPMKDQDYIARGNSFLPLKWMSPESIFQSIYSCQSDVWSYGVLLWEIFSLGARPYPDLPVSHEFSSALKRGTRMSRPEHAPQHIFQLMTRCWEAEPQLRPSFSSLIVSIGNLLSEEHNKRYIRLTEDFLKDPAVVRSRQSLIRSAEDQTDTQGSPALPVKCHMSEAGPQEAEPEEAGPSHGTYIIPISDITIETSGSAALDAASLHLSDTPQPQEVTSSEGKQEEEESCL